MVFKERYKLTDAHKNECIYMLMRLLSDNPDFQKRIDELRRKFPKGKGVEYWEGKWSDIRMYLEGVPEPSTEEQRLIEDINTYYKALYDVARDYGLPTEWNEWGLESLNTLQQANGLSRLKANILGVFWDSPRQYCITWKQEPLFSKEYHRQEILRQFEKQWEQEEQTRVKMGFVEGRKKPKLENHIYWLYERIALKKPPLNIALDWAEQHPDDYVEMDTIEKALRELYKLLSIKAPRNRRPFIRHR